MRRIRGGCNVSKALSKAKGRRMTYIDQTAEWVSPAEIALLRKVLKAAREWARAEIAVAADGGRTVCGGMLLRASLDAGLELHLSVGEAHDVSAG